MHKKFSASLFCLSLLSAGQIFAMDREDDGGDVDRRGIARAGDLRLVPGTAGTITDERGDTVGLGMHGAHTAAAPGAADPTTGDNESDDSAAADEAAPAAAPTAADPITGDNESDDPVAADAAEPAAADAAPSWAALLSSPLASSARRASPARALPHGFRSREMPPRSVEGAADAAAGTRRGPTLAELSRSRFVSSSPSTFAVTSLPLEIRRALHGDPTPENLRRISHDVLRQKLFFGADPTPYLTPQLHSEYFASKRTLISFAERIYGPTLRSELNTAKLEELERRFKTARSTCLAYNRREDQDPATKERLIQALNHARDNYRWSKVLYDHLQSPGSTSVTGPMRACLRRDLDRICDDYMQAMSTRDAVLEPFERRLALGEMVRKIYEGEPLQD